MITALKCTENNRHTSSILRVIQKDQSKNQHLTLTIKRRNSSEKSIICLNDLINLIKSKEHKSNQIKKALPDDEALPPDVHSARCIRSFFCMKKKLRNLIDVSVFIKDTKYVR